MQTTAAGQIKRVAGAAQTPAVEKQSALRDFYFTISVDGEDGAKVGVESFDSGSRRLYERTFAGFKGVTSVDSMPYSSQGNVGMPNSSGGGTDPVSHSKSASAAGAILAIGDAKQGVVLMDVRADAYLKGGDPSVRVLLGNETISKQPAVKKIAAAHGLRGKVSVEVTDVGLSAGFKDKRLATISFSVKISGANGSVDAELSTTLNGDFHKGLTGLEVGKLEPGVASRWGWQYPPSLAGK